MFPGLTWLTGGSPDPNEDTKIGSMACTDGLDLGQPTPSWTIDFTLRNENDRLVLSSSPSQSPDSWSAKESEQCLCAIQRVISKILRTEGLPKNEATARRMASRALLLTFVFASPERTECMPQVNIHTDYTHPPTSSTLETEAPTIKVRAYKRTSRAGTDTGLLQYSMEEESRGIPQAMLNSQLIMQEIASQWRDCGYTSDRGVFTNIAKNAVSEVEKRVGKDRLRVQFSGAFRPDVGIAFEGGEEEGFCEDEWHWVDCASRWRRDPRLQPVRWSETCGTSSTPQPQQQTRRRESQPRGPRWLWRALGGGYGNT